MNLPPPARHYYEYKFNHRRTVIAMFFSVSRRARSRDLGSVLSTVCCRSLRTICGAASSSIHYRTGGKGVRVPSSTRTTLVRQCAGADDSPSPLLPSSVSRQSAGYGLSCILDANERASFWARGHAARPFAVKYRGRYKRDPSDSSSSSIE